MRQFETDYSTLSNGVRVLKIRVPNDELTALTVCVDTGSRNDLYPAGGLSHLVLHTLSPFIGQHGITHETEHGIFKGSHDKTERELNVLADDLPSDWSASTDEEKTTYHLETLSRKAPAAIDLMGEIISDPSFPDEPIELEKQVIQQEIRNYRDDYPATIAEKWKGLLHQGSAMSKPILGTEESVASITREDLVQYFDRFYRGDRILVALAGNIDKVDGHIARSFGRINPGLGDRYRGEALYGDPGTVVVQRDTDQAHFVIGVPGVPMSDPRYYPLKVIETLLGGHSVTDLEISIPSSRLYDVLRVQSGTAYEVTCHVNSGRDTGYLAIQGQVEPSLLPLTLEMIKTEMFDLSNPNSNNSKGIKESEFERAKNFWELYILKIIKNNLNLAFLMSEPALLFDTIVQPAEMIRCIQAVTLDEVRQVAKELISEDKIRLAVLGPFDQQLNILAN